MRNTIITSSLFAATLAFSSLAFAAAPASATPDGTAKTSSSNHRHHHKHRWQRHGHHRMHIMHKLELTDAQKTNMRELRHASHKQAKPEWKTLRQKRMTLQKTTPGTPEYQRAANDLAHATANASSARVLRRADLRSKIHALLTPAQRTQLVDLQAERMERRKQWRISHKHGSRKTAVTPTASSS